MLDFNGAQHARMMGELIPKGTPLMVVLTIRPGGYGDGGVLKQNSARTGAMLDCEFTVDGGPHNKRKFWSNFTVEGDSNEGQRKAVAISMGHIRGMLESARGIMPGDDSPTAQEGRKIASWADLNGLRFPCKVDVEKGEVKNASTGEKYDDKNIFGVAITPDSADYHSPGPQQAVPLAAASGGSGWAAQGAPAAANQGQAPAAAAGVSKPSWAA